MIFRSSKTWIAVALTVICVLPLEIWTDEVRHKRSDDGGRLEGVVENLALQLGLLNAKVAAIDSKTATLDKRAAFYAWSDASLIQTLLQGVLVFQHASTNLGNAYDPDTGVFTAPYSGLYDFQLTFMGYHTSGYVNAGIYVDGEMTAFGLSDNRHGQNHQTVTTRAVVHVAAGSKVTAKNVDSVAKEFQGGQHTTFSGFLVRAD